MIRVRVFPCLLLSDKGLVKTRKFKQPTYVGDPINAVRIFNTKEVDELVLLDITATPEDRLPPLDLVQKIADECQMPLTIGGGVKSVDDIKKLLSVGVEKVVINSHAVERPEFIHEAAQAVGSQSIMVSLDVKKKMLGGYEVFTRGGTKPTGKSPAVLATECEQLGAGELFINSMDHDGTMEGMDIELLKTITDAVNIPVIACGGAGSLEDISDVVNRAGVDAVAAGSMFVFHGPRRAVLINFPTKAELEETLGL